MSVSKKVVLLGHLGVEKSSSLRRFVETTLPDNYVVTIVVPIMKQEVVINNVNVHTINWEGYGT